MSVRMPKPEKCPKCGEKKYFPLAGYCYSDSCHDVTKFAKTIEDANKSPRVHIV